MQEEYVLLPFKKILKESKARAIIQSQSSFLKTCTKGRGLPSLSQIEDCLVIKHLFTKCAYYCKSELISKHIHDHFIFKKPYNPLLRLFRHLSKKIKIIKKCLRVIFDSSFQALRFPAAFRSTTASVTSRH